MSACPHCGISPPLAPQLGVRLDLPPLPGRLTVCVGCFGLNATTFLGTLRPASPIEVEVCAQTMPRFLSLLMALRRQYERQFN